MPTLEEARQFVSQEAVRRNGRIIPQLPKKLREMCSDPHWHVFTVAPYARDRQLGGKGTRYLTGCKEGQKHSAPLSFPILDNETVAVEMNKMANVQEDGDMMVNAFMMQGYGFRPEDSLENWGFMAIDHWPPTDRELSTANARLDATCDDLIVEADRAYEAREYKEISEVHRWAARRRKQQKGWLNVNPDLVACGACGSQVMQNIAVCPHCHATLNEELARKFFPERFKKTA